MGTDHGDGIAGAPLASDSEGDDGGSIAGQVVFATRAAGGGPRIALADELEAGFLESLGGGLDGMIGWSSDEGVSSTTYLGRRREYKRVGEALTKSTKSRAVLLGAMATEDVQKVADEGARCVMQWLWPGRR
jgi:hypothetical protein